MANPKLETEQPIVRSAAPSIDRRSEQTQSNDSKLEVVRRFDRAAQTAAELLNRAENLDGPDVERLSVNELIQRNLRDRLILQICKYGDRVPPGGISPCPLCKTDLRTGSQLCSGCRASSFYQLLDRIGKRKQSNREARA